MARIISSLVMLWSLMQRVSANDDGDVSAQGQGSEIEDRRSQEYSYIPNYGYQGCNPYLSFENKELKYDIGGAAPNNCCGNSTITPGLEACGPELWPFVKTSSFGGNAFFRCQNFNSLITGSSGEFLKDNNQQTPINFQTRGTFNNQAIGFSTMSDVPSTYPPTESGRSATGFSFSDPKNQAFKFSSSICPGEAKMLPGTFEWEIEEGGCHQDFTIGTKKFEMVQFHLHSAEHTVNGMYYPLELHMVHGEKKDDGHADTSKLAVLGCFFTIGRSTNSEIQKLIDGYKAGGEDAEIYLNPYNLLKKIKVSYWHYLGSLTTPPCQSSDKGYVRWFVFKSPIVISQAQAQFFSSYFNVIKKSYNGQNSRPVQKILSSTRIYSYGRNPAGL